MEGIRHRAALHKKAAALAVLALIPAVGLVHAAHASHHRDVVTSWAGSGRRGVDYGIEQISSAGGHRASGRGIDCHYELQGIIGIHSDYWEQVPKTTSVLAHRTCTNGPDDFVWVDPCDFVSLPRCPQRGGRAIDPVVLARRVRDQLPTTAPVISSNPQRGLVGLKTWFWIEGAAEVSDSLKAFSRRVDVKARPVKYVWEFGDGAEKTTSSPGRPYPRRSPVTHVYERSSAAYGRGYPVTVTVVLKVRWRVDGGGWRPLPSISRLGELRYFVAESQAVNSDG